MTNRQLWDEARRLVVQEQQTLAQAAEATGLPLSTIQKRAAGERWTSERSTSLSYDLTVRALKAKVLEKAVGSLDPQDIHAWRAVETAFPEHRYSKDDPKLKLEVTVEVVEQLVEFLTTADRNALVAIQPHLRPFAAHMEARCRAA